MAGRLNRVMVIILIVAAGFARVDTAVAAIDAEAVRDEILAGVAALGDPGSPGKMVVFGESACSVANYDGQDHRDPMIAAANWGQGRVIALPDHQWLNMDSLGNQANTGRFYLNSLAWLAGTNSKTIRIVVTPHSPAVNWLTAQGFTNVVQSGSYSTQLQTADVLVGWLGSNVSQSTVDTIADFVRNGGGLFLCDYGIGYVWWWYGSADVPHAPGNKLLREPGIGFSSDWPGGGLTLTRATGQTTADDVLDMLADSAGFTQTELDIGATVLNRLFQVLPEGDPLLAQLDAAFYTRIDTISPTPASPVTDAFEKALLQREASILSSMPADDVTAHRCAEAVYGAIDAGAPRVDKTVTLDTSRGRWHSTGLYAVPGEVVTVSVPWFMIGKGYYVRINAHTDNIGARSSWERPPYVHRYFSINSTTVKVANAFGGSIFIDFGGGAYDTAPNLGQVQVTISDAIEQPYFVFGRHTNEQWINELRDKPAPYMVLDCGELILCFRSAEAADLTQAEALVQWWHDVAVLQDDLANRIETRTGSELINIDIQNSAGAAHSGFPIQAYDKHWGNPANYDALIVNGSWGDFHELGHNHQRGWWTFSGDGEVTENIFSTYCMRKQTFGSSGGWAWTVYPDQVINTAKTAVGNSSTYSGNSNVGERLAMWIQLADGFGWQAIMDTFATYEYDNKYFSYRLPSDNSQEKDQWYVRFSEVSGYDMTKFMYDTWGLQVSQSARNEVAALNLPDWMPLVSGLDNATLPPGESVTFDIAGNIHSMDDVAIITEVTSPDHGTFEDLGGGKWKFTAPIDYIGTDSFTFTLESSAGNRQTFTVEIETGNHGVLMEKWFAIAGSDVDDLRANPRFPDSPDETTIIDSFDAPNNAADNYGLRMRAFLIPPETGEYKFWIASDDGGELWLGSSRNASIITLIAWVDEWTSHNQWDKFETQESEPVRLEKDRRYYIEALMKEGGGYDNLSVAWQGPGITRQVIAGKHLKFYGHDNFVPVFSSETLTADDGAESFHYTALIAGTATEPEGEAVMYSKAAGPAWLNIEADGALSGTPADRDAGLNIFDVRAYDWDGGYAQAPLQINVTDIFTGELGMVDLAGLSQQWLRWDCDQLSLCGGTDLTADGLIDTEDLVVLASNWLERSKGTEVAHWSFDESAGLNAQDSSSNGFAGELVNMDDSAHVAGRHGNALQFDGIDDHVLISGYRGIGGKQSRTVAAWIKTTDTEGEIISWGLIGTPGGRWVFRTQEPGYIRLEVGGGSIAGSTIVTDDRWHHVAAVLQNDQTPDASEIELYVDGALETLPTYVERQIDTAIDPSLIYDVAIGVWPSVNRHFQGSIDEVRIYSRALTDSEIADLAE